MRNPAVQGRDSRRNQGFAFITLGSLLLSAGCLGGPAPVDTPDYDPEEGAAGAIELYDANGDGKLDPDELEKSAALADLFDAIYINGEPVDTNRDQALDAAEIAARIELYVNRGVGRSSQWIEVFQNGRPVADAEVVLEPEPFMDGMIQPAHGMTDQQGSASLTIKDVDPPGMTHGFYRVRVSKKDAAGNETLPAKFNTATTLGVEIAPMTSRDQTDTVRISLDD